MTYWASVRKAVVASESARQSRESIASLTCCLATCQAWFECAGLFEERLEPAPRFWFCARNQTAYFRHGLLPGEREQLDDREGELLLLEVGSQALAGGAFFTPDIEHVVGDLECDAQVAAVGVECGDGGLACTCVKSAQTTGYGRQFGRLSLR